jgi:D-alanyl-lipoteichoic acid acyltransferase DltB (MBOAT superfamily)
VSFCRSLATFRKLLEVCWRVMWAFFIKYIICRCIASVMELLSVPSSANTSATACMLGGMCLELAV